LRPSSRETLCPMLRLDVIFPSLDYCRVHVCARARLGPKEGRIGKEKDTNGCGCGGKEKVKGVDD
jgi:hypothetical protein